MIRSIYWYVNFFVSLLFKIPPMRKIKKLPPEKRTAAAYPIVSKWALQRVKNSGAQVDIKGMEQIPEGPVLFVSNHQSNFDIAVLLGYIQKPFGFVAKEEIKKIPFVPQWMEFIHCIFLDREDTKKSLQTIMEGIKQLKKGYSLAIFPEGTRSKGKPMGAFKEGGVVLATKAKVPIVPITISGTYKIMEQNNNKIKPAQVSITIHPPIETKGLSKEAAAGLNETVRDIIQKGLES